MTFAANAVGFAASMQPVRLSVGAGQWTLDGTSQCPRVVGAAQPPGGASDATSALASGDASAARSRPELVESCAASGSPPEVPSVGATAPSCGGAPAFLFEQPASAATATMTAKGLR